MVWNLLFTLFVSLNLGDVTKVSAQTFLQFLAESSLSIITLQSLDNFHNISRFCNKKYTVSGQLKHHVVQYFDLRTIAE